MSRAHVIVLGNEKGGSGKSTTAMHLFTALVKQGKSVGAMDLDLRQQSFFRYAENRASYAEREGMEMALPEMIKLKNCAIKCQAQHLKTMESLLLIFSKIMSTIFLKLTQIFLVQVRL